MPSYIYQQIHLQPVLPNDLYIKGDHGQHGLDVLKIHIFEPMSSFLYSGVQHILCCVSGLFFFVFYTLCCQFPWIIPSMIAPSILSYIYSMVHINDKYKKKKKKFTVRSRFILLMICLTVEVVNCFSQPVQNEMKSVHIYWYAHVL